MKLAHIADRVAADIYRQPICHEISTETVIRFRADIETGSDLSCSDLDRLCDMIKARLNNPYRYRKTCSAWNTLCSKTIVVTRAK